MTVLRAQSLSSVPGPAPHKAAPARKMRQPCTTQPKRPQALVREAQQCDQRIGPDGQESSLTAKSPSSTSLSELSLLPRGDSDASVPGPWVVRASLAIAPLLVAGPALAYNRSEAEQVVKNVAGGAYVLLVCLFFFRLLRKRAKSGTSQSFRAQASQIAEDAARKSQAEMDEKETTPLGALWGAAQAGVICYLLFQMCGLVDGYFSRQELPSQYTAYNITITLRTVIRGLAYLVTFLFGANCVGLSGLFVQLLFFPDSLKESTEQETKP